MVEAAELKPKTQTFGNLAEIGTQGFELTKDKYSLLEAAAVSGLSIFELKNAVVEAKAHDTLLKSEVERALKNPKAQEIRQAEIRLWLVHGKPVWTTNRLVAAIGGNTRAFMQARTDLQIPLLAARPEAPSPMSTFIKEADAVKVFDYIRNNFPNIEIIDFVNSPQGEIHNTPEYPLQLNFVNESESSKKEGNFIYLMDHDKKTHALLKSAFWKDGTLFTGHADPKREAELLRMFRPDLIVIASEHPYLSLVKNSQIPFVVLNPETELNLQHYENGAQYVSTRPTTEIESRVLKAHIAAIFRRIKEPEDKPEEDIKVGNLRINFTKYEIYKDEQPIKLAAIEWKLLRAYLQHKGVVLTRNQILSYVGYDQWQGDTRLIDVHTTHLRSKLEDDPKKPKMFKTKWGVGYIFDPTEDE